MGRTLALIAVITLAAMSVASGEPSRNPAPHSATADAPPTVPSAEKLVTLIRSALLTLSDAVETGNFTVLRDRGAPSFQAANTAARLSRIFRSLGRQRIDLASVAVLAPKLTEGPALDQNQRMHVAGIFPAEPVAIEFGLIFELNADRWKLFGISVNPEPVQAAEAAMPNFAPGWDAVSQAK